MDALIFPFQLVPKLDSKEQPKTSTICVWPAQHYKDLLAAVLRGALVSFGAGCLLVWDIQRTKLQDITFTGDMQYEGLDNSMQSTGEYFKTFFPGVPLDVDAFVCAETKKDNIVFKLRTKWFADSQEDGGPRQALGR